MAELLTAWELTERVGRSLIFAKANYASVQVIARMQPCVVRMSITQNKQDYNMTTRLVKLDENTVSQEWQFRG